MNNKEIALLEEIKRNQIIILSKLFSIGRQQPLNDPRSPNIYEDEALEYIKKFHEHSAARHPKAQ